MAEVPLLAKVASQLLEGSAELDALLECSEVTCREVRRTRDRTLGLIQEHSEDVRDGMVPEIHAAESSFEDFLRISESAKLYASDFKPERLQLIATQLPVAANRLELDLARLHEALWVCRGPSSHPGINRLITLASARRPGQELYDALNWELERVRVGQQGLEQAQPSPLRDFARDFAIELTQWLESCPEDPAALAEWCGQGQELGAEFVRYDIHYLWRRHSAGPTPFALLNLVVNGAWLRAQNSIAPELVDCCFDLLEEELQKIEARVQSEERELTSDQQDALESLLEVGNDLRALLRRLRKWNATGDTTELGKLRPLAIELGHEMHQLLEEFPEEEPIE